MEPSNDSVSSPGTQQEMYVIKNLDTGLQMNIADFDRLTTISKEEVPESSPKKKGKLPKSLKAFSKAVSAVKHNLQDVKHNLQDKVQELQQQRKARAEAAAAGHTGLDGHGMPLSPSALAGSRTASLTRQQSWPHGSNSQASQGSFSPRGSSSPCSNSSHHGSVASQPEPAFSSLALARVPSTLSLNQQQQLQQHQLLQATTTAAAAAAQQAASRPAQGQSVRVTAHKRCRLNVTEAVCVQSLPAACAGVVWSIKVSRDGHYLATAGQDGVLRVWQTSCSRHLVDKSDWEYEPPDAEGCDLSASGSGPLQQQQQEGSAQAAAGMQSSTETAAAAAAAAGEAGVGSPGAGPGLGSLERYSSVSAASVPAAAAGPVSCPEDAVGPYFLEQPVREYRGHTEDILDVSWSLAGFLLTASVDRTVKLWHLTQPDCLRTFQHADFVTSVQFHPRDTQRFVSGGFDGKLRLWGLTDARVLSCLPIHQDMITALSFAPGGDTLVVGTMRGRCRYYTVSDRKLEYVAAVDVRNAAGKHAGGKKVTGVVALPGVQAQFLVTTNDSRLRLLDGYNVACKFKGLRNGSTQIRAALSEEAAVIACGSDDGWVYLWDCHKAKQLGVKKDGCYAAFQAHEGGAATAVAFLPADVQQMVQASSAAAAAATGGAGGSSVDGDGDHSEAAAGSLLAAAAVPEAGAEGDSTASNVDTSSAGQLSLAAAAAGSSRRTLAPRSAASSEGGAAADRALTQQQQQQRRRQQQQRWVAKPAEPSLQQVVISGAWNGLLRVYELHGRPMAV